MSTRQVQKRNEEILSRIRDIKAEHPFWGYRRVWALNIDKALSLFAKRWFTQKDLALKVYPYVILGILL